LSGRLRIPMKIRVPKEHIGPFLDFLALTPDARDRLLQEIKASEATFLITDLASKVAGKLGEDEGKVTRFLVVLASLYHSRLHVEKPVEEFVEVVCEAARSARKDQSDERPLDWESVKRGLREALVMDDPLGVTSKATELAMEHGKVFQDARVLTDIRGIFYPDPGIRPSAAIVLHNLKISYSEEDGEEKAVFFGMDPEDIRKLRKELDRALQKESTLTQLLRDARLNWLGIPGE